MSDQSTGCQPLLRWAGSKRQLRGTLARYWSDSYARYIEPFAGSCCLFFWLRPASAILGDKNEELINAYRVISKHPEEVYHAAKSYPRGRSAYNALRSENPTALSAIWRAARFVILNGYSFNGIYRTNAEGRFNVPFSRSKTRGIPSLQLFRACADLLRRAELRSADFGQVIRYARPGDFVYLDPPYATDSRRVFTEYGARPFGTPDLIRLQQHLRQLDSKGVAFVLSYADCQELRAAKLPWHTRTVMVRRNVAGFRNDRRRAREMIISNIDIE
jgi:DNA adenine methylase